MKPKRIAIYNSVWFVFGILIFNQILTSCYFFQPSKPRIALQPFKGTDKVLVMIVEKELNKYFKTEVIVLDEIPLPHSCYYSPRNRYRAEKLIAFLKSSKPERYDKIIGLTNKDISTTSKGASDYGIMGLAYVGGESCVISDFRLKKGLKSKKHFKERIAKVALHEIGHTLGLSHCSGASFCLMRGAHGTVKTIDEESLKMCESCLNKLRFKPGEISF